MSSGYWRSIASNIAKMRIACAAAWSENESFKNHALLWAERTNVSNAVEQKLFSLLLTVYGPGLVVSFAES